MINESEKILEEFEGFVDRFDGEIAHVTLKMDEEIFIGEYSTKELKEKGIKEHRRFKCWTVEKENKVVLKFESIPDKIITEDREKEINEFIDKSIGNEQYDTD